MSLALENGTVYTVSREEADAMPWLANIMKKRQASWSPATVLTLPIPVDRCGLWPLVFEYVQRHYNTSSSFGTPSDLAHWDARFIHSLDMETASLLADVASHLDIPEIIQLAALRLAVLLEQTDVDDLKKHTSALAVRCEKHATPTETVRLRDTPVHRNDPLKHIVSHQKLALLGQYLRNATVREETASRLCHLVYREFLIRHEPRLSICSFHF